MPTNEEVLLQRVVDLCEDESGVKNAVGRVLATEHCERARRTYLRNELIRRARRALRRKKKPEPSPSPTLIITPAMYLDAYRHGKALTAGIPVHDL